MRKLLLFGILFLAGYISKAQKVYFVYLESENGIPFYIKMGDKVYSSSTAGYLILSNLKDSTYMFAVGLVGKRKIEPKFQIVVGASDHGFLIKELDQKLNLFDLQSLELMAPLAVAEIKDEAYITHTDNFTITLSQAANDPSLLREVVQKELVNLVVKNKATSKEMAIEPVIAKESLSTNPVIPDTTTSSNLDTVALAVAKPGVNNIDTTISKVDTTDIAAIQPSDSVTVVQVDNSNKVDSIATTDSVFKEDVVKIEETKIDSVKVEEAKNEVVNSHNVLTNIKTDSTNTTQALMGDTANAVALKRAEAEYKRSTIVRRSESSTTQGFGLTFIDYMAESSDTIHIFIPNPKLLFKTSADPKLEAKEKLKTIEDIEASVQIDSVAHSTINLQVDTTTLVAKGTSSCEQKATDRDFRNLRKEMAALETDEEMINTAVLTFKEKCFTTEQVKNLSTLFLTAQWKYLFFAAVQSYIADAENFATLESEIKDEYYVNKFKDLLVK